MSDLATLARQLAQAEAERDRLREREAHFAKLLGVADGGQYRHDWDGAISRLMAERDAALRTRDDAQARAGELLEAKRAAEAERDEARRERDDARTASKAISARLRERIRVLEEGLQTYLAARVADREKCRREIEEALRENTAPDLSLDPCEGCALEEQEDAPLRALLAPSGPEGEAPKDG